MVYFQTVVWKSMCLRRLFLWETSLHSNIFLFLRFELLLISFDKLQPLLMSLQKMFWILFSNLFANFFGAWSTEFLHLFVIAHSPWVLSRGVSNNGKHCSWQQLIVHWKRLCVRIYVQECKYRCYTNTVGFVIAEGVFLDFSRCLLHFRRIYVWKNALVKVVWTLQYFRVFLWMVFLSLSHKLIIFWCSSWLENLKHPWLEQECGSVNSWDLYFYMGPFKPISSRLKGLYWIVCVRD